MASVMRARERAGTSTRPGGYLRDLTRKAARGEFSLGPMRMALLRLNENRCTVLTRGTAPPMACLQLEFEVSPDGHPV